jgi:hypothetical protein
MASAVSSGFFPQPESLEKTPYLDAFFFDLAPPQGTMLGQVPYFFG